MPNDPRTTLLSAIPEIPDTFLVTIYDPQGTVFSGSVYAISTHNEMGPLSLLSGHANFITLISQNLTLYQEPTKTVPTTVPITTGVMRVFDNVVQIYLGLGAEALQEKLAVPDLPGQTPRQTVTAQQFKSPAESGGA